jgi:general secretion pathway protein G
MTRSPNARRPRGRSGFTLIELLVVIVVIAILASVVAPEVFKNVGAAKHTTAKSQIEELSSALAAYRLANNGYYPTTQQGLDALYTIPSIDPPPTWNGPYITKPIPNDPWGRPYIYMSPGEANPRGYDLYTLGRDGLPGPEQGPGVDEEDLDIFSWK